MTKAEAPKFSVLPLLPDQIPHRDIYCHVTKNPEWAVLTHRFSSGAFLRVVTAASISESMKNSSSGMFF